MSRLLSSIIPFIQRFPWVVGGGLFCLVTAVFLFTRWDRVNVLENEVEMVSREVRLMEQNLQNARSLEEESRSLETFLEELDSRILQREARAANTAYFYGVADGLPVSLSQVNQRDSLPPAEQGGENNPWKLSTFEEVGFSVTAEGRFNELLEFLYLLRSEGSLTRAGSFSLSPVRAMDPSLLQFEIDIRALAQSP